MRYFNLKWFYAVLFLNQVAYAQTLSAKVDELIDQQLPRATVGALIKDAQTGEVIYSRNANKLLTPASSTKLFTAAAAFYYLKPEFHFLTTLSQKGQDYYITFSGSPSFSADNLSALLMTLKKNNVTSIAGDIVIDSSQFPQPYYLSGDSYDDLGWAYTAPDTAAVLNENAEAYELISGQILGSHIQIKPKISAKEKPKIRALTFKNEVITVRKEEEKNHCSLHVELQANNTLRLFGCMMQSKNPKMVEFAIPDPILFIKQVTQSTLDNEGIELKGEIISGKTPADVIPIASYKSANLHQLVRHMLQKSDNLYANNLTRKLGYEVTGKGSHKEGMFAMKKIISEHTPIDVKEMELIDGEGTRYNLIAPEQFVALLMELYHNKDIRPLLLNSLPQAGVSGTLQARMKDTILDKKVFAKTGTMHDVSSLSGFLINSNEKTFVFSIITNGVGKAEKAKALEEKILAIVAEYYLEQSKISKEDRR
ncbi:MAG: D-alanyl-D-alanine carboxypeptidase/D-alanyl-D-alanine-endopeptidase [Legionella sp.]|uniref:D-alanyl-D-alanine carboxypeptidase/D-alanyl-D-alanine endopeptidase n=1 Tax=Legionella sp. TaxID=459 RepID=UPI0039E60D57